MFCWTVQLIVKGQIFFLRNQNESLPWRLKVELKQVYSTFLAVVFILMQHEAAATLTPVAPKRVHTFMLAASVSFGALVLICEDT